MCFYYAIIKQNPRKLVQNKVITEKQLDLFQDHYLINGFVNPVLPVIVANNELRFFEWGLLPAYINHETDKQNFRTKYNTLNAKCETIFSSKMYRESALKRRCLVICSGFYEWREYKGKKFPYFITLKNDDVFVFGGIYNEYTEKETGEITGSYSIITVPANELMEKIHNTKKRMPLIINPENALNWLNTGLSKGEIESFFTPIASDILKAHTIKKFIPSKVEEFENADLIAYYHYPELSEIIEKQGNLFDDA